MGPYKKSFYKSDIVYILFKIIGLLLTFKEILILYLFIKFNIFADLLYYRILRLMDKKTLKLYCPIQGLKSSKYLRVNRNNNKLHLCRLLLLSFFFFFFFFFASQKVYLNPCVNKDLFMTESMNNLLMSSNTLGNSTESSASGFLQNSLLSVCHGGLQLPLVFECFNNILVLPSNFMRNTPNSAVLATRCKADRPHGMRSNLLLNFLVARRDSLKSTKALQSAATTEGLVWQHATNRPFKDL